MDQTMIKLFEKKIDASNAAIQSIRNEITNLQDISRNIISWDYVGIGSENYLACIDTIIQSLDCIIDNLNSGIKSSADEKQRLIEEKAKEDKIQ